MSFELELVVHSDQPSMEVELYKHMHTNSAPVATTCTLLFSAKEGEHTMATKYPMFSMFCGNS